MHPLGPLPHEQRWIDVAKQLATEIAARAAEFDEKAELPIDNLRALHASGLDRATLPVEYGGEGLSYRAFGEIVRIVSAGCPSTGCVWLMHIGAACGLVQLSAPDTARFYADELTAGRRFANALSEPSGGNLFMLPLQSAEPVDGGYLLSGAKRFVSGCEIAEHFLVNALVDGVPTFFGHATDDTVTFPPMADTLGLRATRSRQVSFDGTVFRADRRCPPATPGPNHIAAGIAFHSLGIADAALNALITHARSRTIPTTGRPLAEQDSLRADVADLIVRLDAARLYARHVAWLADENAPDFLPCALRAKLLANQVTTDVAQAALRVGGGQGYLLSSPIQRLHRDAQAPWLMAYSGEVCRAQIGAEVLAIET